MAQSCSYDLPCIVIAVVGVGSELEGNQMMIEQGRGLDLDLGFDHTLAEVVV